MYDFNTKEFKIIGHIYWPKGFMYDLSKQYISMKLKLKNEGSILTCLYVLIIYKPHVSRIFNTLKIIFLENFKFIYLAAILANNARIGSWLGQDKAFSAYLQVKKWQFRFKIQSFD